MNYQQVVKVPPRTPCNIVLGCIASDDHCPSAWRTPANFGRQIGCQALESRFGKFGSRIGQSMSRKSYGACCIDSKLTLRQMQIKCLCVVSMGWMWQQDYDCKFHSSQGDEATTPLHYCSRCVIFGWGFLELPDICLSVSSV
jgi:hypothetical protein